MGGAPDIFAVLEQIGDTERQVDGVVCDFQPNQGNSLDNGGSWNRAKYSDRSWSE